ncbi:MULTISPECIES: threonine-phosphate decarboxylase CobD [unclassified Bradyrhizobium]|uniref:threonine-phosphate decarboxylase CobD n=1 Tax=Bradyrhizobium TaxID=374 RepID=UPI0028ED4A8F|nr:MULTISPECIES: threonine-phosphate decarboxylase CobD [unclassified Bradyrhizobium]
MDDRATSMRADEPEAILHGGDLAAISRRYPDAPQPWIDLSTGINPIPYPVPAIPAESWAMLPSKLDEQALLSAAAARYGVRTPASIVAAAGTQALLQILPRLRAPSSVAVLAPTYEEHELCWRSCGHQVRLVDKVEALAEADVAIVVNPNNPTGRLMPRATLHLLGVFLARRNGLLVVDEAFADFCPVEASLIPNLPPATLVLRSFGKAYGLAGLRLGFAVTCQDLADQLRRALGPWAVSGPALAVGSLALADDRWLQEARVRLMSDGQRLDTMLTTSGCRIHGPPTSRALGGTPLFRLVESTDAAALAERLARHGIHVRRFPAQTSWLRFGLPGHETGWQRLAQALGSAS